MQSQNLRVLLIEDSIAQRMYIKSFFDRSVEHSFTIAQANNGQEGLAIAEQTLPDCILCDINMPVMDGFAFCAALRAKAKTANIPVVMITSQNSRDVMRKAMGSGADDYLTKPFTGPELIEAVVGQVSKRQRQAEQTKQSLTNLRQSILTSLPHELRTPLTNIVSGAELLIHRGKKMGPERSQEVLHTIHRGGVRLMKTITRYLELVEIRSRVPVMMPPALSINQDWMHLVLSDPVGEEVMQAIESDADKKPEPFMARLVINVDAAVVPFDESDLIRIIYELLGNALRFSNEGSKVFLHGQCTEGEYRLKISNFGPALPADFAALMGDFMQFDRQKQEQQGLGLGLSTVKALLELNQARMHWLRMDGQPNAVELRMPCTH